VPPDRAPVAPPRTEAQERAALPCSSIECLVRDRLAAEASCAPGECDRTFRSTAGDALGIPADRS